MEVAIIINVSKKAHVCQRGALGTFIVPPADEEKGFGLLVVRPQAEIQDMGNGKSRREEPIPARKIAEDIIGSGADSMERRGLLVCAAEPEPPRSLERAERDERDFLNSTPGRIRRRQNPITKIVETSTIREPDEEREAIKLSKRVQDERATFENECRKLVKPQEVAKARANRVRYLQEMVAQGDILWSREQTRAEVNNQHKEAAEELGAERPWAYTPVEMSDCGACGQKVKKGVAICPHCEAILDDEKARRYHVGPYKLTTAPEPEKRAKAS